MLMVSACLIGMDCKYDGKSNLSPDVKDKIGSSDYIPVCPEVMGGLGTPRLPSEIIGGDGQDVLLGLARVVDSDGKDVTDQFIDGANACLLMAKSSGVTRAIFKEGSPSCGCSIVRDGTFSSTSIKGSGVATALLRQHGIEVVPE